jgi:CYTH domain-containing protein
MYKKRNIRIFTVNMSLLPTMQGNESTEILQGYLNTPYDTLEIELLGQSDPTGKQDYFMKIRDKGIKTRNEITYHLSKEDFESSIGLCGNKILKKTRRYIKNTTDSNKTMYIDTYLDINTTLCRYEDESEIMTDTLHIERWFDKEVTGNKEYDDFSMAAKIAYGFS